MGIKISYILQSPEIYYTKKGYILDYKHNFCLFLKAAFKKCVKRYQDKHFEANKKIYKKINLAVKKRFTEERVCF
jgi:hypothetical protein